MAIGYTGWTGHRNIGDEALYLANSKLLKNHTILENEFVESDDKFCDTTILGGGTILPLALNPRSEYSSINRDFNFALGVGVRQETFENRKRKGYDLSYISHLVGLNRLYSKLPKIFNDTLSYSLDRIKSIDGVNIKTHKYFTPADYQRITNFDFDLLSVRGPDSKKQLEKYGISSQVIGDPALILEPTAPSSNSQKKIGVCLRGRVNYSWSDNLDYIDTIVEFLRELPDEYEIVFLPFEPQDTRVNYKSSKRIENSNYKDYTTYVDVDEVINELNSCEFVIGEKLHTNILSACCNTPFISIEYMPKHSDFAKSISMNRFNVRNDNLTIEKLNELHEEIQTKNLNQHIEREVNRRRKDINEFSQKIIETISG
jgi:polysaccharide pyruvyl transferase WcaK-like protein